MWNCPKVIFYLKLADNVDMKEEPNSPLGNNNPKLEEGEYYYTENGFTVFTEKYHLKRGYCCKSGCRHCPYGYKISYKINKKPK